MTALRLLLVLMLASQPLSAAVMSVPVRIGAPGAGAGVSGAALGRVGDFRAGPGGVSSPGVSLGSSLPGLSRVTAEPSLSKTPVSGVSPAARPAVLPAGRDLSKTAWTPALAKARAPAVSPALQGGLRSFRARNGDERPGSLPKQALEPVPESVKPSGRVSAVSAKSRVDADWAGRMGATLSAVSRSPVGVRALGDEIEGRGQGPGALGHSSDKKKLNIVLAAAEAVPFVKTGGLADVVDDVSRGLAGKGHNVSVFLPKYGAIEEDRLDAPLTPVPGAFAVPFGDRVETARLWHTKRDGADVYLIEHEELFGREGVYGESGYDYTDNEDRFIFFSRAVLEASRFLDLKPDVINAHDWHAALIAPILKLAMKDKDAYFDKVRSVLTIHNIAFQGWFQPETLLKAGLSMADFTYDKLMHHDQFNFLKAGVQFADAITTVSPTYSEEILREEAGAGLNNLLNYRKADVYGILNGIDPKAYDPMTDPDVPHHYDVESAEEGKAANKRAMQEKFGLQVDPTMPLFGLPARLTEQKGIDIVLPLIHEIVRMGAQFVVLGSGDPDFEAKLDELAERYPKNVFRHHFDTVVVRHLFAASDFLLLPSRFEPCGLTQMFGQRYGALPIASKTGGLADTIRDWRSDPDHGTGLFMDEFSVEGLAAAVTEAVRLYKEDPEGFRRLRHIAMRKDNTWKRSLNRYLSVFRSVLRIKD